MKKMWTLGMVLVLATVMAGNTMASSIAGKVWYADAEAVDDTALMYGGTASLSLSEYLWVSGMYMMGTYEDVGGWSGLDWDSVDGEALLGYSFPYFDVGVGGRYSVWSIGTTEENEEEFQIFGPMVYVGAGQLIGNSPLGWYVGGSYMFLDLGDAYDEDNDDVDTYEHYNIEAGLFLSMDPLTATVGYRVKDYIEFDDGQFKGVAATVGFGF